MDRKRNLLILGMCALSMGLWAQGIAIKEFKEVPSGTDAFHAPTDTNGAPSGLLKVRTMVNDLRFEGNVVGSPKNENNEYFVFLAKGTREITIKRPCTLPLRLNFSDYGIEEISSKCTYQAILKDVKIHPRKNKIILRVSPSQAQVLVDGHMLDNDNEGMYQLLLPKGDYVCRAEMKGYRPQLIVVRCGKEEQNINIELESLLAELEISCKTTTAEIFVDSLLKGRGQWRGLITPGAHTIKVSLNDFESQEKIITLLEKDCKSVTFSNLVRSKASLLVKSNPIPCDVYIDGIYKGESSSIINDLTTGEHNATFKQKFGYKPIQKVLNINSSKDNIVQVDFEPLDDVYRRAFQGELKSIINLAEKHSYNIGSDVSLRYVNTNADSTQSDYWYRKAFEIIKKADDATFRNNYFQLESYFGTLSRNFSFNKALYLYQRYEKVTGEDMCLSFKACYAKNKDWDNAIKYFRKFLDKQSNCSSGLLANMAALYEGKSDYDKALEWYFKAKEKALEEKRSYMGTNDYAYQVYCITTYGMEIAEVYLKKGETHKAVELYRQLKGKIVDDPAGKKLRELGY